MENNSSVGVPHSNTRYVACSYNTYSHWSYCPGMVRSISLWVPQTHMQSFQMFAGSCVHLSSQVPATAGICSSLGGMDMPPKGCQCSRHKEIALPRQGKCAHPSLTLRTIQFSYRGNSKGTLSNRKLDRHKKYLHFYFNNLSYSSY